MVTAPGRGGSAGVGSYANGCSGNLVHVGRQDHVDARRLLGQADVVRNAKFGDHDHKSNIFAFAQDADKLLELGIAFAEAHALGDAAAYHLRPAIGRETENADLDAVNFTDEVWGK